ncbi:uncharacterized protein LOC100574994 [Acyrthosiphon pisum]|uniref:ACYPI56502 protein n=1 Tax=Acyrthosiphon pisum TaxID=7029 RepID=C4WTI3_ACYPI|nr:uncharacterized protein LOC100574994 [Acyrthosiphon pisum]BAH71203.1 ACYPI56502 [Acyrthosiphon pisum]|eukprot:NP_001232943.1 uncharacterized protein LOC100574994 [Acyrthosiphon pisum]
MFLSYATVAVFAYAILLNIFYLYSPVESGEIGGLYENCEKCKASDCFANGRPCTDNDDCDYPYTCFTCEISDGWEQFYSKDECNKGCDAPSLCICDRFCYMCVPEDTDTTRFSVCYIPDNPEEQTCV